MFPALLIRTEAISDLFVSPFCNKSLSLARERTPSACVRGGDEGVRPSPEAGREQKNMVTAHLAVDINARCVAEGVGRGNRQGWGCLL